MDVAVTETFSISNEKVVSKAVQPHIPVISVNLLCGSRRSPEFVDNN
jgi:hypothetical protein